MTRRYRPHGEGSATGAEEHALALESAWSRNAYGARHTEDLYEVMRSVENRLGTITSLRWTEDGAWVSLRTSRLRGVDNYPRWHRSIAPSPVDKWPHCGSRTCQTTLLNATSWKIVRSVHGPISQRPTQTRLEYSCTSPGWGMLVAPSDDRLTKGTEDPVIAHDKNSFTLAACNMDVRSDQHFRSTPGKPRRILLKRRSSRRPEPTWPAL